MQRVFYKNLSALRSCIFSLVLVAILIAASACCFGYDVRFVYAGIGVGAFYALYILLCAKRFFTKVSFSENGIDLIFFGKVLSHYDWGDIAQIKRGVECRRACFALCDGDGKTLLLLERRKEIADIIAEYAKKDT